MTVVVSCAVVLSKGLVVVLVSWFVALDEVVLGDIESWVVDVVIICVLVVGFNVFTVGRIVAMVSWVGVLDGVIVEDVDWVAVVASVVITWFVVVMAGEIVIFAWEEAIVCVVV